MARHFIAASSQYLERAGVPVAAMPMTLSLWVKTSTPGQAGFCSTLCHTSINNWVALGMNTTDAVMKAYVGGSPSGLASATLALPANAWTHIGGVFTDVSARACFLNGANKGTNATTTSVPSLDRVTVATLYFSAATGFYFDGDVAEFAIYNVALSDAQIAQLAAGAPASQVSVANLAAYYPLLGTSSPEPDVMGGTGLTLVNGPTQAADHPTIVSPIRGRMFQVF